MIMYIFYSSCRLQLYTYVKEEMDSIFSTANNTLEESKILSG